MDGVGYDHADVHAVTNRCRSRSDVVMDDGVDEEVIVLGPTRSEITHRNE